MAMPSLLEDCQAWIDRGQESWKSYFSKWETFAKYEETLTESELVHKLEDKCKERRNGNKKIQNFLLSQKRQKAVFVKSQQSRGKKHIRKKKSCQKIKTEIQNQMLNGSFGSKNLSEIIENKQLERTLTTVFSDFLKANRNLKEMFSVLFQTFSGKEMTITNTDYLFPKQILPHCGFDMNVASPSFEDQQVLSLPSAKNSLNDRSICPDRNVYLQSLNKDLREIHSIQIHSKQGQWGSPRIQAEDNDFDRCSFSEHQFLTLKGRQTLLLEQNLEVRDSPPLKPVLFKLKNTDLKSVQFDTSHKSPSSFCQNREYLRHVTISKMSVTQEGGRLGNLCLHQSTNSISSKMDGIDCKTPQRKLSEQKWLDKMLSRRRCPSKKLKSDTTENDSDSDDQTKYHSPLIHRQNKRLRVDEQDIDATESDTDDCQCILDRVPKS